MRKKNSNSDIVHPTGPAEIKKDTIPLRGAAARIVENMEASLTIPTATSHRTIPVKLLEENRRIINEHLGIVDRGKVSFTHIIASSLVEALKEFPSLNSSFAKKDGTPFRLTKERIHLGIAVDHERNDGTRSLVVPNIKNAEAMSFQKFWTAYEDVITRVRKGTLLSHHRE